MPAAGPPDTGDLLAVHEVLRRALGSAPAVLSRVGAGDDDQVAVVATYCANVLALLRVHDAGEEQLLWPLLLERGVETSLVERLDAEHREIGVALRTAEARLGAWAARPTTARAKTLGVALSSLGAVLSGHFAVEEAYVLPVAAEQLTSAEWARLTTYGMVNFAGDKRWLVLGLILETLPPEQAPGLLALLPAASAQFWRTIGRQQFDSFVSTVRG